MGFVLIIFGVAFLLSGYHGNATELFSKLGGELTGTPSFGKWVIAIFAVGAIGYIKPLRPISDAFLVLILLVLFLSDKGFFAQFSQQFGLSGNGLLSINNPPIGNFTIQPLQNYSQFINPQSGTLQ